jgi:hypothetical protein
MLVQLGAEFNGTIWKWPTRPSIHSVSAFAGTTHSRVVTIYMSAHDAVNGSSTGT